MMFRMKIKLICKCIVVNRTSVLYYEAVTRFYMHASCISLKPYVLCLDMNGEYARSQNMYWMYTVLVCDHVHSIANILSLTNNDLSPAKYFIHRVPNNYILG